MVNHLTSNWNYILEELNQWFELLQAIPVVAAFP